MSDFRQRLRNELVDPALQMSGATVLTATIVNKKLGFYTIEIINTSGVKERKSGVKARVYDKEFPHSYKVGEVVLVEYEERDYEIIASYVEDNDEVKAATELKTDVFSSLVSSTVPGYQF